MENYREYKCKECDYEFFKNKFEYLKCPSCGGYKINEKR